MRSSTSASRGTPRQGASRGLRRRLGEGVKEGGGKGGRRDPVAAARGGQGENRGLETAGLSSAESLDYAAERTGWRGRSRHGDRRRLRSRVDSGDGRLA